jgi:hypothetical protein
MSWHVQPSESLKALMDAHVGPAPERPGPDVKPSGDHPFFQWWISREKILMDAVDDALEPRRAEIEAQEKRTCDNVDLGDVALEVLGHPCRWIDASCSLILHSYLGEVVLEAELNPAE